MVSPEVLRRFAFFGGLNSAILKELAMLGEEVSIPGDTWIFSEGDEADALYLILSGTIDLKIPYRGGQECADVETLVEGDMTGWSSLVSPHVYTMTAYTAAGVSVVKLDAAGVLDLMDQNPVAGYHLMSQLAQSVSQRLTNLRVRFVSLVES